MMVECRVEREGGFFYRGRRVSRDNPVIVTEADWKLYGSHGTGELAFVRFRPDKNDLPAGDVDATPSARSLANRENIDLASIAGSGEGGRVLVGDVREAIDNRDD